MDIPRLETPRLVLREVRLADFDDYVTQMTNPEMARWMTPLPDRRTAWRLFAALNGQWSLTGAGWWGIELPAEEKLVGLVGAFFRETTLGQADAPIELGWVVYRPFWRQGIAREAAGAALAWAFRSHPVPRAIAYIDGKNEASIKVSEAIGMQFDGMADFYGEPTTRYAIARG